MYPPDPPTRQSHLALDSLDVDTVTKLARLMPKLTTVEVTIECVATQDAPNNLMPLNTLLTELAPTVRVLKLQLCPTIYDNPLFYGPFHTFLRTLDTKLIALEHFTLVGFDKIFSKLNFDWIAPESGKTIF